jgi:ribonuclease R
MKQRILQLLANNNKAYTGEEIARFLSLNKTFEFKEMLQVLNELVRNHEIHFTNKQKYIDFKYTNLKKGLFIGNRKGFGFVKLEEGDDIYISSDNLNGALHNDQVLIEIFGESEGRIVATTKRDLDGLVGEFYYKKGIGYVDLDNEKLKMTIQVDSSLSRGAMNGHKVVVRIIDEKPKKDVYQAKVVEILGHKNDPGVDILSIVRKHKLNDQFPKEVMDQVEKIKTEVTEEDLIGRVDLRDELNFTIDGADAKDLDDAISFFENENGTYTAKIHIADVTHYVREGTPIYNEALQRGTSVYLTDRVIPMLPHKLSNGICSLNEKVDRLTLTCEINYDQYGKTLSYNVYPSVIHSKKRMTYDAVNEILDGNKVEGYEPFEATLMKMDKFAKMIRNKKTKNGMIDFETNEVKIIVDETGFPIEVVKRERDDAEMLIEDFMVEANIAVSLIAEENKWPFVNRIHAAPSVEKVENFLNFIRLNGIKLSSSSDLKESKSFQNLLSELKKTPNYEIFADVALRTMQKAIYSTENIGHYGLALTNYAHFTSPIRRFPDTTVHQLLRTFKFEKQDNANNKRKWEEKASFIANHASMQEIKAVECEREVNDMKKAEYMQRHIGEEFKGVVSSITSFGFFVRLPNLIDGLVRLEDLNYGNKDKLSYDQKKMAIKNDSETIKYVIGKEVEIVVAGASKEARTVDFVLKGMEIKRGNIKS